MKVLLLGVGMQGKAALYDLVRSGGTSEIIAADRELGPLQAHVAARGYGQGVRCEHVDGASDESVDRLLALRPDVVIDLLPVPFHGRVAKAALRHGVHLLNASYASPELVAMSDGVRDRGLTFLPEFGMDPGLDLVMLGEAVRAFDRVEEIISYGAGFPEPEAADNPLKYKVTWTFEGVLKSYHRAGRVIRGGQVVEIGETEMFDPQHTHELEIEGLGRLEAIPNGDAIKYVRLLGLDPAGLRNAGRYTLRWPGHCAFWRAINHLHLLDDEPVVLDGKPIDRKRFLAAAMEPHLQYKEHERDIVVVRVDVRGKKDGASKGAVFQVIDRRDLETGFTAMSRTVGYTASIGALMIGNGTISKRGVLSPIADVPYEALAREVTKRGIQITSGFCSWQG